MKETAALTANDRHLIELAGQAGRTDYTYLESLRRRAESRYVKDYLDRMISSAYMCERLKFENE